MSLHHLDASESSVVCYGQRERSGSALNGSPVVFWRELFPLLLQRLRKSGRRRSIMGQNLARPGRALV